MNRIKLYLLKTRDFFVRNFNISLYGIKKKDTIFYRNNLIKILSFVFKLIPFTFIIALFKLFNYQLIYLQDDIYQISNIDNNHIIPIIFKFVIKKYNSNNDEGIDLKYIFKYYNSSIPLNFLLFNNKLEKYWFIEIKYLKHGKIIEKIIDINKYINLPLYSLFYDL